MRFCFLNMVKFFRFGQENQGTLEIQQLVSISQSLNQELRTSTNMRKIAPTLVFVFGLLMTMTLAQYDHLQYLSQSGYFPNGLYDIGLFKSTDYANVTTTSNLIDFNKELTLLPIFYKVTGSNMDVFVRNFGSGSGGSRASAPQTFQQTYYPNEQGHFYYNMQFKDKSKIGSYEIEMYKNNRTRVINDKGTILGSENAPVFQFSVPNTCRMKIKIQMNVQTLYVMIETNDRTQIYSGNSKEFDFNFPSKGTYAIILYPNQNGPAPLPITKPAPYKITLSTYCDSFCGSCRPKGCLDCSQVAHAFPSAVQGQCNCQPPLEYSTTGNRCYLPQR